MSEPEVPDDLARLWRLSAGTRLGRPAALDVKRVVEVAVELADRDGLAGATLPKIAAALAVTPMSLYRHIGSKDELMVLMGDDAVGLPPESLGVLGEWRTSLRQWARANLAVHRRHPWLIQLPISGPPRGPNALGWMDMGLRALRDTTLGWSAKIGVITLVGGYVRQAFITGYQLEQARRAAALDEVQALRNYSRDLSDLVDPQRFPDVAELFASGLFTAPEVADTTDEDFSFGLEIILDGVAATISGNQ
ncbi:TetR/AcrR family transcriptional regulator [Nocardia uniformis]|uniref:TetR/AcrR family transcriptional regulator n=1 Tax=Nocardia uniformis TaxID=53432 RepID=A0A849C4P2_9NOCA|nr:TetR/AcrR family transcriptional regulator [Nocardia uniformis]NNH72596.1 TetR/AcrR family transcriptional regulator [Nocardia uniformis]